MPANPFIDPSPALDVSIIICSRNRCASLLGVIQAMYEQKGTDTLAWELIVVDDASTDATRKTVEDWIADGHPQTRYLFEPTIGQAFAMNRGTVNAKGKLLIFTDDDVVLDSRWLVSHLFAFEKFNCAGVGGRLLPMFTPAPPKWYRSDIPFPYRFDFGDQPTALTAPPFGANMAYRRDAFVKYGLFRTDLGSTPDNPAGKGVDSEFGRRLMAGGEKIMYAPDALLYHPLDARLITPAFMHKWYYQYGRSQVLRQSADLAGVRWFGIRRHLIRSLVSNWLKGKLLFDPAERYLREMDVYRTLGIIAEEREQARAGKS